MTPRQAVREDLPRVLELWQTCFGDGPEAVQALLERFGLEHLRVMGPEVEAMALALPVTWAAPDGAEWPGAYLYAVATRPDRRGRGLCRGLLSGIEAELQDRGGAFTCLRPASAALEGMYERMGYAPALTARTVTLAARPDPSVRCLGVDPMAYAGVRELLLRTEFVSFTPPQLSAAGQGWVAEGPGGAYACAIYGPTAEGVHLPEFLGDPALAPALGAALGLETVTLRMPGAAPFAWAKALGDAPLPSGWLGPAFD